MTVRGEKEEEGGGGGSVAIVVVVVVIVIVVVIAMISNKAKGEGGGLRVTKVMYVSVNTSYLDGNIVLLTRTGEIQIQINLPFVNHHDHHVVPRFDVVLGQFSFCSDKHQQQKQEHQRTATTTRQP